MTTTTTDVHSSPLPVSDASAPACILYWDGRLDNRRDLQAVCGLTRANISSAALVLAVYERWGLDGLGRVIGDWSLVLSDPRSQAIVLASDFAGVRPLYYVHDRRRLVWSSRLDALVADTGLDAIDEHYVGSFLTIGGHATRTPFSGIASVPAGHAVSITTERASTRPIWTMPIADVVRYSDERRYDEQLRDVFREAVAVRLQTSAPVIAELSGGLDSSSVVCMASQLIRRGDVNATGLTTISYVHEGSLDYPYIREVEAFCGIEGVHLSTERTPLVTADAVGQGSPQVWAPLHTAAADIAHRRGASTFLTGQSGDLTMGNWYDDSLQVAAPLRSGRIGRAAKDALAWAKVLRVPLAWILLRALRASLPALPGGRTCAPLYGLDALSPPRSEERSLAKSFESRVGPGERLHGSTDWVRAAPERRKHFLALSMMREMRTLQLLEPVRHLDYTHPFAHRPLVEFVMSVPPEVLCGPGQPRRLMRRALGDLWPPRLRARRSKSLFGAPWIDALRPLALGLLHTPHWHVVAAGWVDRASLTTRLMKLTRGLDCNEPQLRQIILLEYWLRNRQRDTAIASTI
jgi:asparagine synthase (glutamine-hydrolysing)